MVGSRELAQVMMTLEIASFRIGGEAQCFESEIRRLSRDSLAVVQYLKDHHGEKVIDLFCGAQGEKD